jgi:spore germination protein KB
VQKNVVISVRQFFILVVYSVIGSTVIIIPSFLALKAKQDAWISAIITIVLGVFLVWMYDAIIKEFPDYTLIEINEKVLGKWLGKMASLIYITYFIFLTSLIIRTIGEFMVTQILVETPIEVIHILFLLVGAMGVRLGLEVLARTAEIFFPWIIFFFTLIVLLLVPRYDFQKIMPILENGFKPVLDGVFTFISIPFLDLIVLLMITPFVKKENKIKLRNGFIFGVIVGGAVVISFVFLCLITIGVDFTARNTYPTYVLAKQISIGQFLERIEGLVAGLWVFTIFFKMSICYFVSVLGLAQFFQIKNHKFFVFPLFYILIIYSIVSIPNWSYFQKVALDYWPYYVTILGGIFPFILLIVAKIRYHTTRKWREKEYKQWK